MDPQYGGDALFHQELQDRSQDIYRVYNPLTIDFKFMYGGRWFTVKAQSHKDMEKYLVDHFYHKISEYIIGQMAIDKGNKFIEERRAKGMVEFMNKYEENIAVWDN